MDDGNMDTLFNVGVITREEGNEHLLYNRTTDQLLMLTEAGLQLLLLYAETGNIGLTARTYSNVYKQDYGETEARVKSLVYQAAQANILNHNVMEIPSTQSLLKLGAEISPMSDIRGLGDLSVAAWAIAAKTAIMQ